jgi:hypothetical protein
MMTNSTGIHQCDAQLAKFNIPRAPPCSDSVVTERPGLDESSARPGPTVVI